MKKMLLFAMATIIVFSMGTNSWASEVINCWFPPDWKAKAPQAKTITEVLSQHSGLTIKPRIATSYPQILEAFSTNELNIVYVGSFVQAILKAQNTGTTLVQNKNGKEFYSGVLVYPKAQDPAAILHDSPELIAYAKGASSGESSAKAATAGKAAIATANHGATCAAITAGKAKAGVVKNWWWEANSQKYPELAMYRIPEISIEKNPDNVLSASKAISSEMGKKIADAAIAGKDAFGAPEMVLFDSTNLQFSLDLMKKGGINPQSYSW